MSLNNGKVSRHNPLGKFERECPACGKHFKTNSASVKYCCYRCKSRASNQHFYQAHREKMLYRALLSQARKGSKAAKRQADTLPDLDAMTPEEVLEYVRLNPHSVRVRRR